MKIVQRTGDSANDAAPPWARVAWAVLASLAMCLLGNGCGGSKAPPAQPAADAGPAAGQPAPGLPVMVREEAGVGVGDKGHDYEPGLITTPVASYFKAKEKIAFEIHIPHAINLHKGLYGSAPATHDEFMEKIVKFNQIQLPELPAGHTYVYDPETEKLMVEHPKGAAFAG